MIVMTRFPKIPKERECRTEKAFRDAARESYYQKLLHESTRAGGQEELSMEDFDTTGSGAGEQVESNNSVGDKEKV